MSMDRYSSVCDAVRKELDLPETVSIYTLVVDLYDKYLETKVLLKQEKENKSQKEKKSGRPKKSES